MEDDIIDLLAYLKTPDMAQLTRRIEVLEGQVQTLNKGSEFQSYSRYLCRSCKKTPATCYNLHWPRTSSFAQEIRQIQRRRSLKASSTLIGLLQNTKSYRSYNNLLRLVDQLQRELVS